MQPASTNQAIPELNSAQAQDMRSLKGSTVKMMIALFESSKRISNMPPNNPYLKDDLERESKLAAARNNLELNYADRLSTLSEHASIQIDQLKSKKV